MNLLIDHTPAENLMLRDKGSTRLRLLLKATLLDMMLKEVLEFEEVLRRPHERDDMKRYVYVRKGPAFTDHVPRRHEEVFLKHFAFGTYRFLFRNMVKLAFEDALNERAFQTRIMSDPMSRHWWSTKWSFVVKKPMLSASGTEARQILLSQITELQKKLVPWLEDGDPKAFEFLRRFGGNVLLVSDLSLSLLPQFKDNPVISAGPAQERNEPALASYASVAVIHHLEFEDAFEEGGVSTSGTTSDGDGSDSGCGGDSGCSGCSGCGGCGGCGG